MVYPARQKTSQRLWCFGNLILTITSTLCGADDHQAAGEWKVFTVQACMLPMEEWETELPENTTGASLMENERMKSH